MELPTPEEFEKICTEHLWLFTLEPDLKRAAEGLRTYNYIVDVIKKGGSVYKKIHRKAFEDFIDATKEAKP
jgi:hypothetical protein